MGYNIKISGEITFEPAIVGYVTTTAAWPVEFKRYEMVGDPDCPPFLVAHSIRSVGAEKPTEDEILTGVQLLVYQVDLVNDNETTFTGYLECQGEEAGDLWRVYVRNGQAVRVDPKIVWPDE